ncbi:MAG: FAD:protein FMN transferase [Thermoplasmata archaeon]|nr:FAD:protein FMN transferase [Thermoplasmata archaeon]
MNALRYVEPTGTFSETRTLMGTYVTIKVHGKQTVAEDHIDAAFGRIAEIEAVASRHREGSELSRLNRDGRIDAPSPTMLDLVRLSLEFGRITGGAFDVTVMPVIGLWSYDPDAELQMWELNETEQKSRIDAVLPLIGYDMVDVAPDGSYIAFEREDMSMTLDGIAKGYAVDQAIALLRERGVENALVNAGGDLAVLGTRSDGKPWHIVLEDPTDPDEWYASVDLVNASIAGSGNYRRFYDPEEKVGHILDPATGWDVERSWSSHIIADNCTWADALATGTFVMGAEDGIALLNSLRGVEGIIMAAGGDVTASAGYHYHGPVDPDWTVVT